MAALTLFTLGALLLFLFADLLAFLRSERDRDADHDRAEDHFDPTGRTFLRDDGKPEQHKDHAEDHEREKAEAFRALTAQRLPERRLADAGLDRHRRRTDRELIGEEKSLRAAAQEFAGLAGAPCDITVDLI